MTPRRFSRPPQALRRAKPDSVALVPASMLPYKKQYQALASQLPRSSTLIVLPEAENRRSKTLAAVRTTLQARGHRVVSLARSSLLRRRGLF